MTNTPTSGRPSDRAIAQAYREACALGAETYLPSIEQRARELDAAHPVAAEAVDAPVAWRLDAVDPETKWPYFSYTNHPGSVTPAHVPLYLRPLPTIAAQASVSEEAPVEWQTRHKWPETNQWSSWLTHADVVSANRHYLGHSSFGVEVQMRELHAKLVVPKSEEKSTCLHGYPHCGCGETLGEFVGAPERITAQKGGVHHG